MTSTTGVVSLDDARQTAAWLAAAVSERRMAGEQLRRTPDDTIDDLVDSGLLRMNQAARWGGLELGSRAVVELVSAVAESDGASGWVFGLLASQAQYDVWGDDPDALMSSSFRSGGQRGGRLRRRVPGERPMAVLERFRPRLVDDGRHRGAARRR